MGVGEERIVEGNANRKRMREEEEVVLRGDGIKKLIEQVLSFQESDSVWERLCINALVITP